MKQESEKRLRKLADYLILNGYSKNVSGLYFGKAGNAVVLFEIARALDDEWIDNHAFELLNQSLLSKTKVCDLLNGVAGIAYALNYAIAGEFIEADANDLFGDQIELLRMNFRQEHTDSIERLYKLSHWIYVLNPMNKEEGSDLRPIALKMAEEEFEFIRQQAETIRSGNSMNNHSLKQRYLLLCRLIDQWKSTEVLPQIIIDRQLTTDRAINRLYDESYWIRERVKPTPLLIRAISDPSEWSGSEDVEATLLQGGRTIKSSLFEGVGRVVLLELCAAGKGNDRISKLLTLPDFTVIQGDQNTLSEEEKI